MAMAIGGRAGAATAARARPSRGNARDQQRPVHERPVPVRVQVCARPGLRPALGGMRLVVPREIWCSPRRAPVVVGAVELSHRERRVRCGKCQRYGGVHHGVAHGLGWFDGHGLLGSGFQPPKRDRRCHPCGHPPDCVFRVRPRHPLPLLGPRGREHSVLQGPPQSGGRVQDQAPAPPACGAQDHRLLQVPAETARLCQNHRADAALLAHPRGVGAVPQAPQGVVALPRTVAAAPGPTLPCHQGALRDAARAHLQCGRRVARAAVVRRGLAAYSKGRGPHRNGAL
mmetsp:Transcript_17833/g.51863  ORF Transcript_17833/g.51863 Transcript_17833/m.51863 type:complete len:285 (-) Transcript_17833:7390-8244(-)